jgi:D-alanine-D-alanine ligase
MLRIALIYGGTSEERKVSLESAKNVTKILEKKYELIPMEVAKDGKWLGKLYEVYESIDLAFLVLHGPGGEDGTVQGVLELLGVKYTCSGVLASALAMDKRMTKRLVSHAGVVVASDVYITKDEYAKHHVKYLKQLGEGTVVVKPNRIGSSVGVTISNKPAEIKKGIALALEQDESILVEQYIEGREFTVPVLGNTDLKALPVIEIVPKGGSKFFDFRAKYDSNYSDEIVPAQIPKELAKELQEIALKVHSLLKCRGVTRSDFIVTKNNEIYFLEINTIPGMTSNSLVPKSAAAAGIIFPKLLDRLIDLALNKE